MAWLEAYRQRGGICEGLIVTYDEYTLFRRRHQNRLAAGITYWPNSAMRHSYCSYWLALHKDVNKLVLQSRHTSVEAHFSRHNVETLPPRNY